MLFNSIEFLFFFPIVTLLFYIIPHRFRWLHLLTASSVFYAFFIPGYVLILLFLISIDYTAGILLEKKRKKSILVLSIIANIGLLAVFKYFNFFIENINSITGSKLILLNIILPIGLSFHTFQSLSYTIEVYRGNQKAVKHFGYYALYVMFYPQLVAGPIERPQNLFPQLFRKQKFDFKNIYTGLRLMIWGFFKKVVIADRLGDYVDSVYSNLHVVSVINVWLAILFFSLQIYADFSGYSDIAIGSAKCMGFDLMTNFKRPYFSSNIKDFWNRWHISLSTWFKDYIYIPLGGNRKGVFRKQINLIITFGLSGLWHGAGWTYITWGLLHGVYISFYDLSHNIRKKLPIGNLPGILITFFLVTIALVFFRAPSLSNAFAILNKATDVSSFSFNKIASVNAKHIQYGNFTLLMLLFFIIFMFTVEFFTSPKLSSLNNYKYADTLITTAAILCIIFWGVFYNNSFIYFQF